MGWSLFDIARTWSELLNLKLSSIGSISQAEDNGVRLLDLLEYDIYVIARL